jgi:hypothetical protein
VSAARRGDHEYFAGLQEELDNGGYEALLYHEMARLYRLALNGRLPSHELTRLIYTLKEIRACLEAETLTDIQQRLVLLSREVDNPNGQRVAHQPALSSR